MGFTTGFTGGVTLTLGVAYLTVLAHERNRQAQAQALRSQSRVLQGLLEPTPLPPPQSRAELAREERSTLVEAAKDRWNNEIESAVRRIQRTDWSEVREGVEATIARLLGGGLQKSREGLDEMEKQARPKIQEAVEKSKAAARTGAHDSVVSARNTWDRGVEESHDIASKAEKSSKDALSSRSGTVDAPPGAIRGVISKGIEKGKEAIGKVQAVAGISTESAGSKTQSIDFSGSEVDKALHERFKKPDGLNRSVDEALAERYKPIDSRDNTVLRGV